MIRILIVDDEAPTRVRLRQMLGAHPDVEVVGEAESGTQAMEMVGQLRPEVLLLDIQMPGSSGIDVAACLPQPRPHVVFCTAHDQYAVEAFELNAVDYLLKPINRARLAQALDRIRTLPPSGTQDEALDRAARPRGTTPARFLARKGAQYVVIGEDRVQYFGSEGSLTRLTSDQGEYWMDPSLNDLERRLDATRFFRISRAALINLNAVTQVEAEAGGGGHVTLRNNVRLEVSRRRFRELLNSLAG
ncbi:response regulator [uncultured Paludibaculum sp.]|uniref:LytR/AlgR family response regulator transcription factor n=1 Tax=uncultured Paludibaculum sp. TaxID=1765020 RepID=UPI002AAB5CAE|nr:response regulator [uncultured Paludibaculum sp.]